MRWRTNVDPTRWARTPIDRRVWDDAGYKTYPVEENGDAMVAINGQIAVWAEEAFGAKPKITPLSGTGFGASPTVTVREPVLEAMLAQNKVLERLGLEILIVCGHRGPRIQGNGFASRFWEQQKKHQLSDRRGIIDGMSVKELIEHGQTIDKGYLRAEVIKDQAFERKLDEILFGSRSSQIAPFAAAAGKTVQEVAAEYITYRANLIPGYLRLDGTANKPHGTGGSVDATLKRIGGDPVFTGSPSGDTGSIVRLLHYFERWDLEHYRREVAENAMLRQYVADFADEFETREVAEPHFDVAQANIRTLYWAMLEVVNASGYNENDVDGEWWHWNFGASFDGPGAGCHQICMGYSAPAVWGAQFANNNVAALVGAEYVY